MQVLWRAMRCHATGVQAGPGYMSYETTADD